MQKKVTKIRGLRCVVRIVTTGTSLDGLPAVTLIGEVLADQTLKSSDTKATVQAQINRDQEGTETN